MGRGLNRLISQPKSIEKENAGEDPGFYQRRFNEIPPQPGRVVWGYPSPENFEILSPRKCDFSHCEA